MNESKHLEGSFATVQRKRRSYILYANVLILLLLAKINLNILTLKMQIEFKILGFKNISKNIL